MGQPHSSSRPLLGKSALVTGAARGIGRAISITLARHGADVALLDIADPNAIPAVRGYRLASLEDLQESVRLTSAEGVRTLPLVADIRDRAAIEGATRRAVSEFGALDILVANAGVAVDDRLETLDPESWRAVVDVNLTGTMQTALAALPSLKRPGARIIIITSLQARLGVPDSMSYSTTKWALTGMMKSLAAQLGPEGITVNAVAPTAVDTAMLRRTGGGFSSGDAGTNAKAMQNALPVGALRPQDIADGVAFLAGPAAHFISGTTLDINAGRSAQITA